MSNKREGDKMEIIKRIHHISAIVGNAQQNVDFYRNILGLYLVKQTINFDDPGVYHLYFSHDNENPAPVMTFFNWENGRSGKIGSGQVGRIAFRIPKGTLSEWGTHLNNHNIEWKVTQLFNKDTIELEDIHGLDIALVEGKDTSDSKDIVGFHGAVLLSSNSNATKSTLVDDMGLAVVHETLSTFHFETKGREKHHIIVPRNPLEQGYWGVGTIHHIAWSVPNDEAHVAWREKLTDLGYGITGVKDREYFNAMYMREKGHVIFEFATDTPGFDIDEPKGELGQKLMLPSQYEGQRAQFEAILPPLEV